MAVNRAPRMNVWPKDKPILVSQLLSQSDQQSSRVKGIMRIWIARQIQQKTCQKGMPCQVTSRGMSRTCAKAARQHKRRTILGIQASPTPQSSGCAYRTMKQRIARIAKTSNRTAATIEKTSTFIQYFQSHNKSSLQFIDMTGGTVQNMHVGKKRVSTFLKSLYRMLADQKNYPYVSWSPSGNSFDILNIQDFSQNVLPFYFKHRNISSFIRQLNMYDFHKVRSQRDDQYTCFYNNHFKRDSKETLHLIGRKQSKLRKAAVHHQFRKEDIDEHLKRIQMQQDLQEESLLKILEEIETREQKNKECESWIMSETEYVNMELQKMEQALQNAFTAQLEMEK